MIGRYSLPAMATIWSEAHRLEVWHNVELLTLEAWAKLGAVPAEAIAGLREAKVPSPEEVAERENVTDHDLAAFVDLLAERVPAGGEWIHFGLTSSDVLDTAGGAICAEGARLLVDGVSELFATARRLAQAERDTVMIGRTHGIWAEPTSFGLKVASWAFELARDHDRMAAALEAVAVGKISGAVGSYAHTPPEIEEYVCQSLGLSPEPASSQVTARDRHSQYLSAIALTGATLERIATEIRHLQRSEVGEVREPFRGGQKGSSAMPHKRNPILSERITGMARLLRGYAQVGLENVALWHERDISHSSAERVALP
ncbi:MAG: adenylosuccinate lyase, partial [Acidimicrobiia bacterium]